MCGSPCLCVCGPVRNKSGHSSEELACAQHIGSREKSGRLSSLLMLAEKPSGDHMPESAEESFCVINTKSLGVPRCQGPQQGVRRSQ